jgi:16S rRNA (guanine(527)-N(7))-methyltransferase RsmG
MRAVDAQRMIATAGLSYAITGSTVERINGFVQLRAVWNRTHNLMGPKAAREPWRIDVCDAVALAQIFDAQLPLFDVGSGSGVPGLLLGVLVPKAEVVLVEPLSKRAAFLKTAIHQLELDNVRVMRCRWPIDELPKCQVISRAVVSPETWPALANADHAVVAIYRYLALNRPQFTETDFRLMQQCDYQRSDSERLCLEQWQRAE